MRNILSPICLLIFFDPPVVCLLSTLVPSALWAAMFLVSKLFGPPKMSLVLQPPVAWLLILRTGLRPPPLYGQIHFKYPFFNPFPRPCAWGHSHFSKCKISQSSLCKPWLSLSAKTAPGKTAMCAKHALGTKQTQLGALWISDIIHRMQSNYVHNT